MTRRSPSRTQRDSSAAQPTSSRTPRVDGLEELVLAFAEQLGRFAGTVQAKTAGWMDGDTLKMEFARVRDGAADLLQQLTADAPPLEDNRPTAGAGPRSSRDRSRGMVDAPGKKHRPPMATDPGANRADSQAAKMRAAKTMVNELNEERNNQTGNDREASTCAFSRPFGGRSQHRAPANSASGCRRRTLQCSQQDSSSRTSWMLWDML